ncbi:MAG: hypothetical protein KGZ25_15480, partial [Planctomycetes bacterium]|nr:hypothetical protein [Planctomycetota bacterium]
RPAQFDTRRRRNDGTELIVTDMMYQANGSGSHAPSNTQWSSGIPYFNPHVEYCARAVPERTGHQLTADNAVRRSYLIRFSVIRFRPVMGGCTIRIPGNISGRGEHRARTGVGGSKSSCSSQRKPIKFQKRA